MEEVAERLEGVLVEHQATSFATVEQRTKESMERIKSNSTPYIIEESVSNVDSGLAYQLWGKEGSKVATASETFVSRLEEQCIGGSFWAITESRERLKELCEQVEEVLGKEAVSPSTGVFNEAR